MGVLAVWRARSNDRSNDAGVTDEGIVDQRERSHVVNGTSGKLRNGGIPLRQDQSRDGSRGSRLVDEQLLCACAAQGHAAVGCVVVKAARVGMSPNAGREARP